MTRKIIYLTVMARRSMELGIPFIGVGHEVEVIQPVRPKLFPPDAGERLAKVMGPEPPELSRKERRVLRGLCSDLSAQRLLRVLKERDPGLYEEVRKVLG